MITSSHFFDKTFFPSDRPEQKVQSDAISPWSIVDPENMRYHYSNHPSPRNNKDSQEKRGYQISRNSSIKYIQKKLKARALLHKGKDPLSLKDSYKYHTIQQKLNSIETKKYHTLQQKLASIEAKKQHNYFDSVQILSRIKKQKKKVHLFPQITINQYNDIKAKGLSLAGSDLDSIDGMLQKRRNRKKLLEDFGKLTPTKKMNIKIKELRNNSMECKSVLSGRYVCIAKNPQFSVNGLPTTKMLEW